MTDFRADFRSDELKRLLEGVKAGELTVDEAERRIRDWSVPRTEDLGFAKLDIDREKRTGFPEVVFGEGKSADQIARIMRSLKQHTGKAIATRVDAEKAAAVLNQLPEATYKEEARILYWFDTPPVQRKEGYVAVVCAGTSDLPIAEEAAFIAEAMGSRVERVYDVGVSGLHRLLERLPILRSASAIVVVAGMEGALVSVIGGLVNKPIVAVPTSVGYGAHFNGLATLLAMLNSCAPGVSVVNIDNGFGAGYYAGLIHQIAATTS